jgi:hypothetical protein
LTDDCDDFPCVTLDGQPVSDTLDSDGREGRRVQIKHVAKTDVVIEERSGEDIDGIVVDVCFSKQRRP